MQSYLRGLPYLLPRCDRLPLGSESERDRLKYILYDKCLSCQ
nr:MAG TPA: hypothetical protein [Caudoviricetes sp.]